jgi:peroxiredoxin
MKRSGQHAGVLGKRLRGRLLAASAASVIAFAGGAVATPASASSGAPNFSVTTIDGKTFTLAAQRGKVVVLDFLAGGSCAVCAKEARVLDRSAAQFASKGVRVLVVDMSQGSASALRSFYQGKVGVSKRLLVAPDKSSRVAQSYRVLAVGTTYIVGRDGSVRWHGLWLGKEKELLGAIAQAAA